MGVGDMKMATRMAIYCIEAVDDAEADDDG